jgi:LysR family transcriptional regulator, salicylic acid-responsive activator of bsdBCD
MNIIQLKYFKYVVDEMSVTNAARRLFVTQSAVSQQIRLLEEGLECKLFYRKGQHIQITQDGEFLYQKTKNIISQFEGLRDELKSRGENVAGKIKIGSGPIMSKELLPDVISNILTNYPDVSFSLFESYSRDLVKAIIESRIDLGLGQIYDNDERISSEELLTGRLVLICSSQDDCHSLKSVSLQDLSRFNLISCTETIENKYYPKALRSKSSDKDLLFKAKNTETIIPYVRRGMGVTLAPDYIIKLMNPEGISIIRLEEEIPISWGIMRDKFRIISKAEQVFIDILKQKILQY